MSQSKRTKVVKINPQVKGGNAEQERLKRRKNQREALYGFCIILLGLTALWSLVDWLFF